MHRSTAKSTLAGKSRSSTLGVRGELTFIFFFPEQAVSRPHIQLLGSPSVEGKRHLYVDGSDYFWMGVTKLRPSHGTSGLQVTLQSAVKQSSGRGKAKDEPNPNAISFPTKAKAKNQESWNPDRPVASKGRSETRFRVALPTKESHQHVLGAFSELLKHGKAQQDCRYMAYIGIGTNVGISKEQSNDVLAQ